MRISAIPALAAIALLLLAGGTGPGHAAGAVAAAAAADADGGAAAAALRALAGSVVPNAELGRDRARGVLVNEAVSAGSVADNRVGARSVTGIITNTNSVNNNNGLTTVFQNTGNNSLFQSSTSIYINIR